MKYVILMSIFLMSCTSFPTYQERKSENEVGYQIQPFNGESAFEVTAILPENAAGQYARQYVGRAVAEHCSKNHFPFFDFATPTEETAGPDLIQVQMDGYCYKEAKRRGLGLTLEKIKPDASGAQIEIESTNRKPNTFLKSGDFVLEIAGVRNPTISDLKRAVHAHNSSEKIPMEIMRDGKRMSLQEPINILKDFNMGPDALQFYQQKVK